MFRLRRSTQSSLLLSRSDTEGNLRTAFSSHGLVSGCCDARDKVEHVWDYKTGNAQITRSWARKVAARARISVDDVERLGVG